MRWEGLATVSATNTLLKTALATIAVLAVATPAIAETPLQPIPITDARQINCSSPAAFVVLGACTHKSPRHVRFRANRTLSRHRRMTESGPEADVTTAQKENLTGNAGPLDYLASDHSLPMTAKK